MNYKHIGLIAGVLLTAAATAGGWFWISQPSYKLLLSTLEPEQNAAVTTYLNQQSVAYEERDNGIWLPEQQVSRVRMELAEQGIIQPSRQGLEMFATTDYGMTEFAQKVNYQRALQAELERSIVSIEGVQQARVHLKLPTKQALFSANEPASASVMLHMHADASISSRQVTGIQLLVASAIENLDTENVVVVDQAGKILSLLEGQTETLGNSSEYEQRLATSARQLLNQWVDENQVAVAVTTSVNHNRKTVRNEQVLAGQVSKRSSNVKEMQGNSEQHIEPSAKTLSEEYVHGRRIEEVQYGTGQVERISVGIVVSADRPAPDNIADIEQLLKSGLGIDSDRGDSLSLVWRKANVVPVSPVESANPAQPVQNEPIVVGPELVPAQSVVSPSDMATRELVFLFLAGAIAVFIMAAGIFGLNWYQRQQKRKALLAELTVWLANE